ncbi:MAG: FAD-dependent oxidoreductase [Planctomycetota bacterium]
MYSVAQQQTEFTVKKLSAELCVVGGGMAGLSAALAAARNGTKVLLIQDRAVLGGNASSEIRMHVCGAHGADNKESGIVEEIMLENTYRNPEQKYTIWDDVLYGKCMEEENLILLLSCSVNEVEVDGDRIASVRAWHLTEHCLYDVTATLFADCSGDSVLRVSGAEFRVGREARDEFGESHAPQIPDSKTMGHSLLIQLRAVEEHVPFIPPAWAHTYTEADLPNRNLQAEGNDNFWWLEFGGLLDTIEDSDSIRDECYKISYGVWNLIKNHPDGRGHGWELDWIGALPGKRENVRYVGDHILTQNDVEAEGRFDDVVAYGGWSMDDHHPEAIAYPGKPTIFHPAPSPYGVPYRCLYSRNIENLFFAGRNISATHMAMSSTRVMATCAVMGQAVGVAASLAVRDGLMPRGVYENAVSELQARLLDQDCYLPWQTRAVETDGVLTASTGDPALRRNGIDRILGEDDNGWWGGEGESVEIRFDEMKPLSELRLTLDSDFSNKKLMPNRFPAKGNRASMPAMLLKDFDLEVKDESGSFVPCLEVRENWRRYLTLPVEARAQAVRLTVRSAWGGDRAHLFGFDVR